jgi:hypothetical protein
MDKTVFVVVDIDNDVMHVASSRRKAVRRAYALLERDEDDDMEKAIVAEQTKIEGPGHSGEMHVLEFIVDDENM